MQTVLTLIKRRVLWRLIWVCTVCQLPFWNSRLKWVKTLQTHLYVRMEGVVGWCEGVLYLTSPGRPTVLAYSWARPAILVAGKGRGGCFYFFCFFTFISVPLSSLSLSFISSTISSIFFLPFSGRRHKMTHKG